MNILDYLESRGIEYRAAGKNVMKGCVVINCPLCTDGDPSMHLNLSLSSDRAICFRCGKYSLAWTIAKIDNIPYPDAKRIVQNLEFDENLVRKEEDWRNKRSLPGLDITKMFSGQIFENLSDMHINYLESRKFDAEYLQYKYKLMGSSHVGPYKFRVIFPVIMGGKIVSFVGRDVTGLSSRRYMNLDDERSLIPRTRQLYNLDSVKENLIITEGPTDVCRFGSGAVATLSIAFTSQQISEIVSSLLSFHVRRCFVIYDPGKESQKKAKEIAQYLALIGRFDEVKRIDLVDSDLGDLGEQDIAHLRRELFKTIY